jgi:hypothetical protein
MVWRGRDLSGLPAQFDPKPPGSRTLILDGDGPCYRACTTAKTLPTALRRFVQIVLEIQYLTNCSDVRIHLTAKGSKKANRKLYPSHWVYQDKRGSSPKPPLLEPLRQAVYDSLQRETGELPPEWWCELHNYWEADDGIIMDAVRLMDDGVVWSEDKDMRLTPGPYFEVKTGCTDYLDNRFGWIGEDHTPAGKLKVVGHGTKFFWAQMLMGDSADRVRGLTKLDGKLIAERGTLDFLQGVQCEHEAANAVLAAYGRAGQNPLAEAEMMWLRRGQEDSAYRYLTELDLVPNLRQWVDDLHGYHQQVLAIRLKDQEEPEDDE